MAAPVEQQPVDQAAELEAAVAQAIEACGGDPVDAVRALIVANAMLEQELADVYAKASHGLVRRNWQQSIVSSDGRAQVLAVDFLIGPGSAPGHLGHPSAKDRQAV